MELNFRSNFSTATEVVPVREVPSGPGPTPLPSPERPRSPKRGRWILPLLIILALLSLSVVLLRWLSSGEKSTADAQAARTAVVEQKDFVRTLRVHGIVEAVESHMIAAPRISGQGLGTLIITKLPVSGSSVHRGEVLVEFDRQAQLRNVIDKQAEYRDLVEQIRKMQADQAATRAADETELKQAEDAGKTAELEVRKNEIVSRIDAEKNQENLEQAKATLEQLRQTFTLKRQAAQADLRVLEIQRDRALDAMKWAQGNTEKMVIHSPVDGVAVINSMWKGGSLSDVQEGDEVRPGFGFMQVVNPGQMQVRAKINQADIDDVREGQNVVIHLDAYPDLTFSGNVVRIAGVAQTSAFNGKVRVFTTVFSIKGSDPKLLPDLSAAVDIEIERQPNALVVPRDAVFSENGHNYVQLKNGSGYDKQEVKTGAVSDLEEVILSGVQKGAVVLRNAAS